MYRILDLFAGAGGMSLGFRQTGKFEVAVAIEKNENAMGTYKINHGSSFESEKWPSDILGVDFKNLKDQYGDIDVVVGGPPCQGFSNANRQKNHIVSLNNGLVKKYVEAILSLQPKAFVMENVRMLKSETHRFFSSQNDCLEIERLGISKRKEEIILSKGESPLSDIETFFCDKEIVNELVLTDSTFHLLRTFYKNSFDTAKRSKTLATKGKKCLQLLARIPKRSEVVSSTYVDLENSAIDSCRKYVNGKIGFAEAAPSIDSYIEIQKILKGSKELFDNNIIIDKAIFDSTGIRVETSSYSVVEYLSKSLGEHYNIADGVLNAAWYGAPQTRERYISLGISKKLKVLPRLPDPKYKPSAYRTVSDAIKDLESIEPSFDVEKAPLEVKPLQIASRLSSSLRDSELLFNHVVTETRETALKRFESLKPGQNFHDLDWTLIENTYTSPEKTQNSIYLRLDYDKPCGTVTNVRKSMWIHPTLNRAISIREAARLQTFPDSFVFVGSKDSQYQQVGNAVPPIMAKAIADVLAEIMQCSEQEADYPDGSFDQATTKPYDVQDKREEYQAGISCKELSSPKRISV
ncbi:DNA cytosine methyltransferase [Paenibacillus sp. P22]|uniref:DNA cytosine methyltransferase n=1 Tax=Paenibacillus sp. P22 TaxID=483908 RepID=UPI00065FDF8C|nr:DNA cytosine methyltransferase [Paenibacillus sp. P22]